MSRTWVDVAAAAAEWSDCGGGRGGAGIRTSNLGKNMTKTPNPTTESDLEREYHRNRSRKRKNSKQLNLPYGNLIIMNLKNSTQRIELGKRINEMVSTRLAGAHAGQCQQAPWISASIRISLPNIYKPIETESETLYPTHHCSVP